MANEPEIRVIGPRLADLEDHPGWLLVRGHLAQMIEAATARLETDTFGALAEVSRVQGEIMGLREAGNYLLDRLNRYRKAQQKGAVPE